MSRAEGAFLCVVLGWALALRTCRLSEPLFRVDEAESTINALTVLEHGYPSSHYLGLPIFENVLTQPWPESEEYEFKDNSYSERGVAIYHAWLPLYAVAGSLRLFGFGPDRPEAGPGVRRTSEEIERLTRAARAPSVAFGMLLLVLLFRMAEELHGRAAAWLALSAGAFSSGVVDVARQARYYSLTTLLSTACCLLAWRIHRHGRRRDFAAGGLAFALLFHTHVVAFLISCGALVLVLPWVLRRPGAVPRMALFSAVVLALTAPWARLTGFLDQAARIPMAWPYLRFPEDLLTFLWIRPEATLLLAGGSALLVSAHLLRGLLPLRFTQPFLERRGEMGFLMAWMVVAYLGFTFLVPAVSYSLDRLALPLIGPAIVLGAGQSAAVVRVLSSTASLSVPALVPGLLLAGALSASAVVGASRRESARPRFKEEVIDFLRGHPLGSDTRVYATPNHHLLLTVYTGLPVQNVAPVRKQFLDRYPGEIVLVEINPFRQPPARAVRDAAAAAGVWLGAEEGQDLAWYVSHRAVRERLSRLMPAVEPRLDDERVPAYLRALIDDQPRHTEAWMQSRASSVPSFPAVFRGFRIRDWDDWWRVYFYRFVDPKSRTGALANYHDRVRTGRATVLASGVTVYQSRIPVAGTATVATADRSRP